MSERTSERTASARVEARAGGRDVEARVEIDAAPERVWRALTDAAELERWFPLEARVEPGEGGEIFMSWKNEFAGSSDILAWDPPAHLRVSWGGADGASAQVTDYRVEGRGGGTALRVVTSGFPDGADWDEWVEGTRLGWLFELTSLRRYLEEHPGEDRRVVYLRRRVDLSRPEAWRRLFDEEGPGRTAPARRTLDVEEPRQYVAELADPPGALLRISTEPCGPGVEELDVTVFLSAWGEESEPRVRELDAAWRALLEERFPEGETV